MPDAPVLGASKKVKLDETAFTAKFNGPLVHQSVRAEQAARRRGTAATKTRGMVSGGGAKPWKQKGTGRARAGSTRSPIWTGGGTVFGPKPRSYTFKVNRKEQRAALRSALSLHAERGSIAILDAAAFDTPSTKAAAALLADWGKPRGTLVVVTGEERGAGLGVQIPRGLVGEDDGRVVDQGPGHGHPLLLATGELARPAVHELHKTKPLGGLVGLAPAFGQGHLLDPQRVGDVVGDVHVREQGVVLEDHRDIPFAGGCGGDVAATQQQGAARGALEPGDGAQQCRLAAPGRPQECEELALGDGQVEVVHGSHAARVGLGQSAHLNTGHQLLIPP